MISQRIVWTLLPNGVNADTKRAKASVLVSPRLSLPNTASPSDLSHFPNWHDWPNIVRNAKYEVSVTGGGAVSADLTSQPDSAIWQAIFPPHTFVKPWAFDEEGLADKVILSYPVAALADLVETLYGDIGVAATSGLPKRRALKLKINGSGPDRGVAGIAVAGIRPEPRTPAEVLNILRRERKRFGRLDFDKAGAIADQTSFQLGANQGLMSDPNAVLDLLQAYHTPLEAVRQGAYKASERPDGYSTKFPGKDNPFRHAKWDTRDRAALPAKTDYKNLIDFHRIVASLGQYAELNRLCGLVLDIEFDRPNLSNSALELELKVDWQNVQSPGPAQTESDVKPKIAAINNNSGFYAAPRSNGGPVLERYLRLSNENFSLIQMDVDGAGMKLKNLRESLKQDLPKEYDDETFNLKEQPETEAGLPSLRTGGIMLAEKRRDLSVTALLQRADAMQSDLENSAKPPTLFAEDVVRGFRVDIHDNKSNQWQSVLFRKTEFKFTHTGGGHVTLKEEGMSRLAASGSTDNTNTDVIKIHEALVNWSGWSLAASEPGKLIDDDDKVANEQQETPPGLPLETKYAVVPGTLPRLRFGRTYSMRARLVDLAGASEAFSTKNNHPKGAQSQTVTLRRFEPIEPPSVALVRAGGVTDPIGEGESMQRIVIRTWNNTPDKNTIATDQTARRHVVPPRVGHRFAEMHGVLDTGPGSALDKSLYPLLISRDKPLAEETIARDKPAFETGPKPEPEQYAVADVQFSLPFLPDPLAIGAAIKVVGADGADPQKTHIIPLYCSGSSADCKWPNAKPFKIVIAESGLADATFDSASREFRIPMKKAERARVYVSSLLPKDAISMMAVHQMILRRNPNKKTLGAIEKLIQEGQHWMFTPWRIIELVHAVQKPLITPEMKHLQIDRLLGDTAADPGIESLPLHSKSTGRADMHSVWMEPVDDPADLQKGAEGPYAFEQKAHAFSKDIARNDAPGGVFNYFTGRQNFADTRYRRVKYRLDATTRYKEFFKGEIRANENNLKVTSPVKVGWVRNSAPPPPPNILYVVPTFGWARSNAEDRATSMRAGGGLRVYLDRPWMTTGFTEMLGVVLPHISGTHPVSNADADDKYKKSITMWGTDPIWSNPAKIQTAAPPLSAFPLAKTKPPITFEGSGLPEEEGTDLPPSFYHTGLPHPETKDGQSPQDALRLDVAPHVVGYDPDRRLWYCDIVIRPPSGTYFPFVRLALARYNPISVSRAHLSTIAMTEFQQLAPDRLVIVTKDAASSSAHIAVYGVEGASPLANIEPDRFQAETQTLAAGADPDLDWRTVKAPKPSGPRLSTRTARMAMSRDLQRTSRFRAEAEQALRTERLDQLVARPDLMLALRPPLIWETDITLPQAPAGGKRRILVIEKEHHRVESDDLAEKTAFTSPTSFTVSMAGRIVYLETLEF